MIITNTKSVQLLFQYLSVIALALTFPCCTKSGQYGSPAGYDLSDPKVIKLPSELDDISGIAYYQKDNSLFAESDQKGCVYKIFLNKPTDIRKWKFSHKRDYEDIVLLDSTIYILNNNGDIVSLNFIGDSMVTKEFKFTETGKYEFESLYYDDKMHKLILVAKDCDTGIPVGVCTFSFDPQTTAFAASFTIDASVVTSKISPASTKFKPSAASVDPVTGELFIVSSINKLLVVADRNGVIKNMYKLNPTVFNHPEGITFTPSGGMFISNEAGDLQPASILYYQFKKNDSK